MSESPHPEPGAIRSRHDADPLADAARSRTVMRRASWITLALLLLLALGAGRTVFSRIANAKNLESGTESRAVQYVKTSKVQANGGGQKIVLPGTLQGQVQSPIAARASGYLKRWTKDIGSHVEKGELLAEIETPEISQQLSQAQAARQQAVASLALARSSLARWEGLRQKDVVSQQELDERRSAATQAEANLAAADANVQRLRQTEDFRRVTAPFAGVITRRSVDTGDLIDAGGGTGRTLFVLTQTDPLRVYVNVPQSYAQWVKPGQKVVVTQSELAGQRFAGEVARTSASLDQATRTMQVEIALPNHDGVLLPGAYVQVELPLPASTSLTIPANALLIRSKGVQVATLDAEGVVALKSVKLGRNLGETVEVLDGLRPNEVLVLNPSDSIAAGDKVAVAPPSAVAKPS